MSDLTTSLALYGSAVLKDTGGRETIRSEPVVDEVIERVSEGEFLRPVLRDVGVGKSTWYDWVDADSVLAGRIARARDQGYDARAERLTLTARGKTEAEGGESTGDVLRDKLIIDTEFKALAKWSPRYRDGVDVTSAGAAIQSAPVVFAAVFPPGRDSADDT